MNLYEILWNVIAYFETARHYWGSTTRDSIRVYLNSTRSDSVRLHTFKETFPLWYFIESINRHDSCVPLGIAFLPKRDGNTIQCTTTVQYTFVSQSYAMHFTHVKLNFDSNPIFFVVHSFSSFQFHSLCCRRWCLTLNYA